MFGFLSKNDKSTASNQGVDAELLETDLIDELFAEFDAIDARVKKTQAETRKLERDNQIVLSELRDIVARLWAG